MKKSLITLISFLFLGIAAPTLAGSTSGYLNFTGDNIDGNGSVKEGKDFSVEVYIKGALSKNSGISTIINYDSDKLAIGTVNNISNSSVVSSTSVDDGNITISTVVISDLNSAGGVLLAEIPTTAKKDIDNVTSLMRIDSQKVVKDDVITRSNITLSQINGSPTSSSSASSFSGSGSASYIYDPMEKIPGTTEGISYFPDYVKAIYKFAIWAIGIAALLMISVGGFMYFTAAGNTSKLEKAKIVIRDAILGIIAVLVAYLILYVINPDLVNVSLESLSRLGGD